MWEEHQLFARAIIYIFLLNCSLLKLVTRFDEELPQKQSNMKNM